MIALTLLVISALDVNFSTAMQEGVNPDKSLFSCSYGKRTVDFLPGQCPANARLTRRVPYGTVIISQHKTHGTIMYLE